MKHAISATWLANRVHSQFSCNFGAHIFLGIHRQSENEVPSIIMLIIELVGYSIKFEVH